MRKNFEFWVKKRSEYPDLAQIACEILATPALTINMNENLFVEKQEIHIIIYIW